MMKKLIICIFFIIIILSNFNTAQIITTGKGTDAISISRNSYFAGGSGTKTDPYKISNVTHLQNMKRNVNAHYILINNIDASSTKNWNNGKGFETISTDSNTSDNLFNGPKFKGSLNGQGYSIINLTVNSSSDDYKGLIGYVDTMSIISNVAMLNAKVSGDEMVGGLVGHNYGNIINCTSVSEIEGQQYVGGIVGYNLRNVTNCYSDSIVIGNATVGGVIGLTLWGWVKNCHSSSKVIGVPWGTWGGAVGGLIGSSSYGGGGIDNCSSNGTVIGRGVGGIGGLMGGNGNPIRNCFSTADVITYDNERFIGGLIGSNSGDVRYSYCKNNVTSIIINGSEVSNYFGGFAGKNSGQIHHCYSMSNVSGQRISGFVGHNSVLPNPTGTDGIIENCTFIGVLNGSERVSGFVGTSWGGKIKNCTVSMDISSEYAVGLMWSNEGILKDSSASGNINGNNLTAGLVGYNHRTIINCSFVGNVTGRSFVGGLVGYHEHDIDQPWCWGIERCHFNGNVTGRSYVGGLVGYQKSQVDSISISNSQASGNVYGVEHVGGLIGYFEQSENDNDTILNCQFNGNVVGNENVGGFAGVVKSWGKGFYTPRVESCEAHGNVIGKINTSAFAGYLKKGFLTDCYSTCKTNGEKNVGGMAGYNYMGQIENCLFKGSLKGDINVGGLIGYNDNGTLIESEISNDVKGNISVGGIIGANDGIVANCSFLQRVDGKENVGGIVGENLEGGYVIDCRSNGVVNGSTSIGGLAGKNDGNIIKSSSESKIIGEEDVGGLIGKNTIGEVNECFNIGEVTGDQFIGGIVGYNVEGSIRNCYSYCNITATSEAGGIAGSNLGLLNNSYSLSKVSCNNPKGIVGYNSGSVENCFWDTEITGISNSDGGLGKNSSEMKNRYTFQLSSWDFENIWEMKHRFTYPFLIWEKRPYDNYAPFANNDHFSTARDQILITQKPGVLANDEDPEFSALFIVSFENTSYYGASVNVSYNGSFTYDPTEVSYFEKLEVNEYAVDSFEYTISDTKLAIDTGKVFVNVTGINNPPRASNDFFSTREDKILTVEIPGLLENDMDPDKYDEIRTSPGIYLSLWDAKVTIFENGNFEYDPTTSPILQGLIKNEQIIDQFNYTVLDKYGDNDVATVFIVVSGENDAPLINLTDIPNAFEDQAYSYTLSAEDLDKTDGAVWIMVNGPDWLTLSVEGLLSGIPDNDDVGSYQVEVKVIDFYGAFDTGIFPLTVINTNDAPKWIDVPEDIVISESEKLMINILAVDDDKDAIEYGLTTTPHSDIAVDIRSGVIKWPNPSPGIFNVLLSATDGVETIYHSFNIEVIGLATINTPPVVEPIQDVTIRAGEQLFVKVKALDNENDHLLFSLVAAPREMKIFINGTIQWIPRIGQEGEYLIVVKVSDYQYNVTTSFRITVEPFVPGQDDDNDDDDEDKDRKTNIFPIIIIVLILILAGAGVGVFLYMKKKSESEPTEETKEETPPEKAGPTEEEKQVYQQLYGPN